MLTILDLIGDEQLLGASFGSGWGAWEAFLAGTFGLPMTEAQAATFWLRTGRQNPPTTPAREAWCIVGRRGGKSKIAATIAVYLACLRDYSRVLSAGETATLPVIASDRRQARVVMGYITGLLDSSPLLAQLVRTRTAEAIELSTRVRIEIHTASWRALRGYTVVGAVLDEICFWRSDDSANPDTEIVNAVRPAMATVPNALLVAISSPHARRGVAWEQYRRWFGVDGDTLVWQAGTRDMNASVPQRLIDEALAQDEPSARAEYCGEFRRDLEAFISRDTLDACTIPRRLGLPPRAGTSYVAFVDPSGGSADSFTLAIGHAEERDGAIVAVLDYVAERTPPFSPEAVVAEFCEALASYRVTTVVGDRYAGEWPREQFLKRGVTYEPSERSKSEVYQAALPLLNSGRGELLDHPRLQAQLLALERRVARGGRESIDHPPNGRDDLANSAMGALVLAATGMTYDEGIAIACEPDVLGTDHLGRDIRPIDWSRGWR